MQNLNPRPNFRGIVSNPATAFQIKPPLLKLPAVQAVRAKAELALNRISASPIATTPVGQAFLNYLRERLARGEDMEEFIEELREKAAEEIGKRRHIVSTLTKVLDLLRGGDTQLQVRREIIQAARSGQLTGAQAWDRLSRILNTPFPFLTWMETQVGPMTIGLSMQIKGGMGAGAGYAEGIAGLRHCLGCFFRQISVCAGAVADADFGIQLSVSGGKPIGGISFSVEAGGGGGYGATAGVSVSFDPNPRTPTVHDPRVFDYQFSGLSAGLGGGGGLDVSVAFGVTYSRILGGPPL